MKYARSPLLQKGRSATELAGFSTVEALFAAAIFGLLVTAFVGAYLFGQEATALAGRRARAVLLAHEGLEATRNIRDAAFANLTDGVHGLAISGNRWLFSGVSDGTDIFTRQITITPLSDSNHKTVTATVTWQQNPQRTGSVSITTHFTNWLSSHGSGSSSCSQFCQNIGTYNDGTCRKGAAQCTANGETPESGGNPLCTHSDGGVCCCAP